MKLTKLIPAVIAITLFNSCKNDLEINAPWRETPVIYGFLDINKDTQYIRVQKTYQNDVDLTTAEGAQISDSLVFKDVTVKVGGVPFTKITSIPKNSGFFASDINFIYQARMVIDQNKTYNLEIFSSDTKKSYTSSTGIVGKAELMKNSPNYKIYIRPHLESSRIHYQFKSGLHGAIYDVAIRFWYKEYPNGNPGAFVLKSVDYFLEKNIMVATSIEKTYVPLSREFVFFMRNAIKPDNSVTREFHQIDYVAIGGSKEMRDIIDLSKPSAVIVQRKTDYSNINGALGIFSSRSETIKANMPFQNDPDDNGVDSTKIYLVKDIPNFIY